jgi:phage terminase large subunit GpA-like protein
MAEQPFASEREISRQTAEIILPPKRIRPSEAVEKWLHTEKGPWVRSQAPMMVEPLDMLASRQYQGIVFAGPSRSSKTMTLVLGGITYIVTCNPGDVQVTQQNQDEGRKWSKTDLSRAIEFSDELAKRLSARPRDDNVFDKFFTSGMMLQLAWPTASQHSSKTLKYIFITDYDQAPNHQNVDQRGTLWNLAFTRIRTYMSRGKCLAESSPGDDLTDPTWRATSPHEAPPVTGILEIYNLGTRARYYWQCMHCSEYFEAAPGTELFKLPSFEELEEEVKKRDLMWLAEQFARVACPSCGGLHEMENKVQLNTRGRWVHAGESIDAAGRITGERRRTNIASYWQGGVTATFQQWDSLLFRYFQAIQAYVQSGSDQTLKTVTNTDLAIPYLPRAIAKRRGAEELMSRVEHWTHGIVPKGVRFLIAALDVQSNRFVVQITGYGVGLESWIVDRFVITASNRQEGEKFAAIDPASFVEDWDVIVDNVFPKQYECEEAPGFMLGLRAIVCDSGGKDGVTTNAYEFYRRLRRRNLMGKIELIKGTGNLNAPRVQKTWPDAKGRKDRHGAQGDVPIFLINVNVIKDGVIGDLGRDVPGPGFIHLPDWLPDEFFDEITAETRNAKGIWEREGGRRNEAIDLQAYSRAACIMLNAEQIDWHKPPKWATPIADRVTPTDKDDPAPPAQPPPEPPRPRRNPSMRKGWVRNW